MAYEALLDHACSLSNNHPKLPPLLQNGCLKAQELRSHFWRELGPRWTPA